MRNILVALLEALFAQFVFLRFSWLLGSMHDVIQVPPDGVVVSSNCCCHPFAAYNVGVTVYFSRQTVSALTSGLSRYSAQPTPS